MCVKFHQNQNFRVCEVPLLVSKRSEENRALLEEAYWNVGMEEAQELEMKVSRRIEKFVRLILMQRVSVSTNRYISWYVNSVNYGAVVIRGGKPDRIIQKPTRPLLLRRRRFAAWRIRFRFACSATIARNLLYCNASNCYASNRFLTEERRWLSE